MLINSVVTVCATSTQAYLAGPQALKDALGITTTSHDAALANIAKETTDFFNQYVGYNLLQQTYLETIPSFGDHTIQVHAPIASITSIYRGSALVQASEYSMNDAVLGLIYRELGWPNEAGVVEDLVGRLEPYSERPVYAVEYVGGYTYSTCADASWTLPRDIHRRAIEFGVGLWKERLSNKSVVSEKVGDLAVTYGDDRTSLGGRGESVSEVTRTLREYRRIG